MDQVNLPVACKFWEMNYHLNLSEKLNSVWIDWLQSSSIRDNLHTHSWGSPIENKFFITWVKNKWITDTSVVAILLAQMVNMHFIFITVDYVH